MSRRGGTERDRAQRGEATRAALIAAARELFVTKGYFATGTEEIVAKAKVGTRGALYHHFADKQALFRAVFEAVEKDLLARASPTNAARDVWDQLVAGLQGFLTAALEPEVQRIILVDGPAVLGWKDWRELEARYGITIIEGALAVAMDEGTIRTQPRRVEPGAKAATTATVRTTPRRPTSPSRWRKPRGRNRRSRPTDTSPPIQWTGRIPSIRCTRPSLVTRAPSVRSIRVMPQTHVARSCTSSVLA